MSGEWAASVKSNIGPCVKEEGEHSTPIFINIALYKTGVATATIIRPLFFLTTPCHMILLTPIPPAISFTTKTKKWNNLQGFLVTRVPRRAVMNLCG